MFLCEKKDDFYPVMQKDIGTLYLMFALFSGLIGTAYSVLIRLELSGPWCTIYSRQPVI